MKLNVIILSFCIYFSCGVHLFGAEDLYCHTYAFEASMIDGKSKRVYFNKAILNGQKETVSYNSSYFPNVKYTVTSSMQDNKCIMIEKFELGSDSYVMREDTCTLVNFRVQGGWYSQNKVSLKSGCILSYQKDFDKAQLVAQEQEFQESRGYMYYTPRVPQLRSGKVEFKLKLDSVEVLNQFFSTSKDSNLRFSALDKKFSKNVINITAGDFERGHSGISSFGVIRIKNSEIDYYFNHDCSPYNNNKTYKYDIKFKDLEGKVHDVEFLSQCKMEYYTEIKIRPDYQKEVEKKALSKENKK
jgi:hypothetical protein